MAEFKGWEETEIRKELIKFIINMILSDKKKGIKKIISYNGQLMEIPENSHFSMSQMNQKISANAYNFPDSHKIYNGQVGGQGISQGNINIENQNIE